MTAFPRLVEIHGVALRGELGSHLAGMAGMHAVIARRGRQQDRRIVARGFDMMLGRQFLQERPIVRILWIAIFADPAGAGGKLGIALHIEQGHGAIDGGEQIGFAC